MEEAVGRNVKGKEAWYRQGHQMDILRKKNKQYADRCANVPDEVHTHQVMRTLALLDASTPLEDPLGELFKALSGAMSELGCI